jgi:histidine triad (HIT) family protein
MDCVFCAIAAGDAPAYRVAEDEHALAVLDINPLGPGHTLVVPRIHVSDLLAGGATTLQTLSPTSTCPCFRAGAVTAR